MHSRESDLRREWRPVAVATSRASTAASASQVVRVEVEARERGGVVYPVQVTKCLIKEEYGRAARLNLRNQIELVASKAEDHPLEGLSEGIVAAEEYEARAPVALEDLLGLPVSMDRGIRRGYAGWRWHISKQLSPPRRSQHHLEGL